MPRALTAPELALLRADTQWSKLYLAIYQPNTVYTALLNGVPASNDRVFQITYDGGSGTLTDVKPNMMLYVGTTAGAHDLGTCRIRKAPGASTFYIGLTSEIAWADNCYLTVVDIFELQPKHPVVSSGTLIMDVDIEYSDQHADYNPVPVLGSHAVAWLDDVTVDVDFYASDSWVFDSTISTYAWVAPGSSASSGMATATPTITYDTPGCYRVLCTVTAANGKSTLGARHVFVYDRDANMPSTVFQLSQCIADYDSGGWMFDMSMEAEASLSEINDRALVVLFADDWYGATKQSIGPLLNRENIVCMGNIVGQSIRWDRESGLVHFTVQGFQHWLNKIKSFPVELLFTTDVADSWSEIPQMTVDRALFHLLFYHSTVIETMDFYPTGDTRLLPEGKSIASKLWGQLQDIAMSRLLASPGIDRFGRLFVEIDPQMIPEVDRDWETVMALTAGDWQEGIEFQRVTAQECSLISLSTQFCNVSGSTITLYSLAPGHVPLVYGEPEMADRILADTQAQSNQLAGLILGARTNEFPNIPVKFAMHNRMFDLFPRQFASLVMSADDNPRGVAFNGNLIPRRITLYYDADSGWIHPEIDFEAETFEQINVNGDVPDIDETSMEIPPIPDIPDLPDLPALLPGLTEITSDADVATLGPRALLVHDASPTTSKGMLYSRTVTGDTARKWQTVNAGLTATQYQKINRVVVCPNGAVYVAFLTQTADNDCFIARAPYVGGTFVIVEDHASLLIKFPAIAPSGTTAVFALGCNTLLPESIMYIVGYYENGVIYTRINNAASVERLAMGVLYTASLSYGLGNWILVWRTWAGGPSVKYGTLDTDGEVYTHIGSWQYQANMHRRVGTSGKTFHWLDFAAGALRVGTDNLTSVTDIAAGQMWVSPDVHDSLACDPSGTYLMAGITATGKGKSSDGGASWVDLTGLPYTGPIWMFAYAGGVGAASRWVACGSYLYFTKDFGVSWVNIQGNLPLLSSLYAINTVNVIEA